MSGVQRPAGAPDGDSTLVPAPHALVIAELTRSAESGSDVTLADYQCRILLGYIGGLQLYGIKAVAERARRAGW